MYSQIKMDLFFRRNCADCFKGFLRTGRNAELRGGEQTINANPHGNSMCQFTPCLNQLANVNLYNGSRINARSNRYFCTVVEVEDKLKPNQLRPSKDVPEEDAEAQKNARLTRVIEYIRLMVTSDKPIIMEDLRVIKLLQLINEAQIDKSDKTGPGKYPGRSYDISEKSDYRDKISPTAKVEEPSPPLRVRSAWGRPNSRHLSTGNVIHFRPFCTSSDKDSTDTKELICSSCSITPSVLKAINEQINWELYASYTYLNIASFFDRSDVALDGFYNYFMFMSEDETNHALMLINFANSRGGKVKFSPIKTPEDLDVNDACTAIKCALALEREVTSKICLLQEQSEKMKDSHTADFITATYVYEQFETIREMELLLSQINLVSSGVGIYMIDKDLYQKYEPKRKKPAK